MTRLELRLLGVVAAGITVLVACAPAMAPLEKPGTIEAQTAPPPLSAPASATAEPSVHFQPAPVVGAPIGPATTNLKIENVESPYGMVGFQVTGERIDPYDG